MFERIKTLLATKVIIGIMIMPIIIWYKKTKLKMQSFITQTDVEEDTQDE